MPFAAPRVFIIKIARGGPSRKVRAAKRGLDMQRLHEQPTASEFAQLSRGAPFFSALMVGLAVIAYLDAPSSRTVSAGVLEPTACGLWDKKAVEGITPLLYEDSAVTDLKLNEAFTQLRRARAYCKAGWVAVAKQDYESLHRTFPVVTGSIRSVPVSAPELSANKRTSGL
jgi:hypothetical protein